jgi:DNA-directed RNA polymerase II subunit RPB2
MSQKLTQDDLNKLIKLYFNQPQILYKHLIDSYNQLVEEIIPNSISNETNYFYENVDNNLIFYHGFNVKNIRIRHPIIESNNNILYPYHARKNQLNYFGSIIGDVEQIVEKKDILTGESTISVVGEENDVSIANIPIMVKTKYCSSVIKNNYENECKFDPGGYFIVSGQEKVVVSIEKMIDNKILIFSKKESADEYTYTVQVNSKPNDWTDNLQIINIKNKKNGVLVINSSQIADIPVFVLFRALGLESDKDIISNITYDLNNRNMLNLLRPSINNCVDDEGNIIKTKEDAFTYLTSKLKRYKKLSQDEDIANIQRKMHLKTILKKQLLPHLGEDIPKKIRYLGYMINKMLKVMLGEEEVDDRDSFENKRIETPGVLIGQLFRQNFKKMLNEISKNFKKKNQSDDKPINIINQIQPNIIEQGIKTALATGVWGMNRTKKGVAQALQRLSWILSISYLRRVMSPSLDATTSKVTSIRHINNVQYQFICPVETPEGQKIGQVKNLAIMASVTINNHTQIIILNEILEGLNIIHPYHVNSLELNNYGKIFINGDWIGCSQDILSIYETLKEHQKKDIIDKFTTISVNYFTKEIYILCDAGRLIRPILNVKDNKLEYKKDLMKDVDKLLMSDNIYKGWNSILKNYPNLVEYHDTESSRALMVADSIETLTDNYKKMTSKGVNKDTENINRYGKFKYVNYSHIDFHRWTMMGIIAVGIPFANHNFATKNIINYSQERQSIGIYLTSYKDRMDISQILYNPQIPMVTTEGMKYNQMMDLPAGENAVVAIMSYTGYNQEDSIIMNESAIKRGIFMVETLKKYHSEIQKNPSTSQDDIFTKPDPNKVTGMKQGNYDKLNDKGFLEEETPITNGDIIIGKVSPIQPTGNNNKIYKDSSEKFKSNVDGVIDRVHTGIYNKDGYEAYNVRVRMQREPIIGDKFTNRHGQKGTVGIILPQKDMPFTADGIVPDIIMNPHAIPSRMTVANLIECLASKIGAIDGKFMDGTPFNNYDVTDLPKILKKLGYSPYGTETMYCGMTGKKMDAQIFIGPTFYKRLKHMVLDKIHSRSRGPRQALTRQPLEGRSRDGGLKIGEMEKDSMVAHGIGQFLKERMMETSDLSYIKVCDDCGLFASKVIDKDYYTCESCHNSTRISTIAIPYATKVLFQELMSINVLPKIMTE